MVWQVVEKEAQTLSSMNGKSQVVQDQLEVAWTAEKDGITMMTWMNPPGEGQHDSAQAIWLLPVQSAPVCFYKGNKKVIESYS